MSGMQFLTEKRVLLLFQCLALVFSCAFLMAFRVNVLMVLFLGLIWLLSLAAGLFYEFLKKAPFYNESAEKLENLDQKYLISELLETPDFYEGLFLTQFLNAACKSMNDQIAAYRIASKEYREYIETWVHEIKTPISAGKLLIENHPDEVTQGLDSELSRIEQYVEQALFYARSTDLEKDYLIRRTVLSEQVANVLKQYSRILIQNHAEIKTNGLDRSVYTDPKWLDFILSQLMQNCIKYQGEKLVIEFSAYELKNSVIFSVEDSGIGISSQDLKRIFEKGFTGENGRKFAKSTGIGLYLCKRLCEKMGLAISAESQKGKGTKIILVFPKNRMHILGEC